MSLRRLLWSVPATWRRIVAGDASREADGAHQVAALPVRMGRNGIPQVLLVSTRGASGRLIIPRGWPMAGKPDHQAAAIEAEQEAGVLGRVTPHPIGAYVYRHARKLGGAPIRVDVYRLDVGRQVPEFKERGQRRLKWLGIEEAARRVADPGLAAVIRGLAEASA